MEKAKISIYGALTCSDTMRARKFLDEGGIPYEWIDIDDNPEGLNYVKQANNGVRVTPTILFEDGSILVEPSNAQLASKLGI